MLQKQYTQTLQLMKLNLEIIHKSDQEMKRRNLGLELDRMS
jgi:hypothetical protein